LCLEEAKGSSTTGTKIKEDDTTEVLDKQMTTRYRSLVARLNYMSSDRPDIQYTVKELCREMSSPTTTSFFRFKRLGRYLRQKPRLMIDFDYHLADREVDTLKIYCDTDWAGCPRTRRSTNGGCALRGTHLIKSWSTTQAIVALSSGEAEFYGLTRAVCTALGLKSLCADFRLVVELQVYTDSTAAKGITQRRGLGKLRHMDVQYFWLQEKLGNKEYHLNKVLGTLNPSDIMTKYLDEMTMVGHLVRLHVRHAEGRSAVAPLIT